MLSIQSTPGSLYFGLVALLYCPFLYLILSPCSNRAPDGVLEEAPSTCYTITSGDSVKACINVTGELNTDDEHVFNEQRDIAISFLGGQL